MAIASFGIKLSTKHTSFGEREPADAAGVGRLDRDFHDRCFDGILTRRY